VPAANATWRDLAVEAASARATDGLRHLRSLAVNGDQEALAALADIGISVTRTLSDLARRETERVRPIARCRYFWPFLKARRERFGDAHKDLVKRIELGHEAPFSEEAVSRIRETNVCVRMAMKGLCRIELYRHKNPALERMLSKAMLKWEEAAMRLKPFSAKTWPRWFEVAWQAVLTDHDGHPERDPELKRIGLYRAEHSTEKYGGTQPAATPKTRNANIQDGIRERLQKAIKQLANLPKKSSKR
jgi:hypothetical protein